MREYKLVANAEDSGKRIDLFLLEFFKKVDQGISRAFIQELIHQGKVEVSHQPVLKPNHKVKAAEEVKVIVEDQEVRQDLAENIPLEILYEDADLAVVNKPIGLVTHPAPGNFEHTLVNALLFHFDSLSTINPGRPGIVHRLDKETSGILVIAKNNAAHLKLAKQFADHSIKRQYLAIVSGKVQFDQGVIEAPLARHPFQRKNIAVDFSENAKYAKTFYRTIKRTESYSVLELEPFTGRTHQLRVHLAFLGHPILGDLKYGKDKNYKRLFLHAKYLGFIHPATGKWIEFNTGLPDEFKKLS